MIYFDQASSTKLNKELRNFYVDLLDKYYGNPNSNHRIGRELFNLHERARKQILDILKLDNHELIFVSGATEANNLAIIGYANAYKNRGMHLITSLGEHPSVLNTFKYLETQGFSVSYLPLQRDGTICLEDLASSLRKDTILVSIMMVNNETGAINDLASIRKIISSYSKTICFHSDVVQGFSRIPVDYSLLDMFSFSAHKIHGLDGSGALIKRKNINLLPIVHGGGQENTYRSGTQDTLKDVILAKCVRLAFSNTSDSYSKVNELRNVLVGSLLSNDEIIMNSTKDCSPYIINFSLKRKKASVVVEALSNNDIMVSSLSACSSKKNPESYVIYAMKKDHELAMNSIRVSINDDNNLDEVKTFINVLNKIFSEVRDREL